MTTAAETRPLEGLRKEIEAFCRRWDIRSLELFGSAARGELGPDSDLDFLVTFGANADWGLFDHVRMQKELESLTGRRVDLLTRRSLEYSRNPLLRDEILRSARSFFPEAQTSGVSG